MKKGVYLMLAASLLLFGMISTVTAKDLTVAFIDSGEGDSIFLDLPTGEKILIDTGNVITGHDVARFLKKMNVNQIDALFITHPHLDHMSGIFHIVPTFDVSMIYDNGQPIEKLPSNDVYRWYRELIAGDKYSIAKKGDIFTFGKVTLEILWPKEPSSDNWNENSMVIMVRYGENSFLLMGDATQTVEGHLLSEGDIKSDLLKVGHHGAIDSAGTDFLKAVSPKYTVISVNDNNIRGYPDKSTIARLEETGAKSLFTNRDGNIIFRSDGNKVRLVDSQND